MVKPTAVIVDVDGTLCDISGVLHYIDGTTYGFDKRGRPIKNFDRFHAATRFCPANQQAIAYCEKARADGHLVMVVTARMRRWLGPTLHWLRAEMTVPFGGPFMRPDGDGRPDVDIKREIHARLAEKFDIVGAIDDNPAIIALWRELSIPVEIVPRPAGDVSLSANPANRVKVVPSQP